MELTINEFKEKLQELEDLKMQKVLSDFEGGKLTAYRQVENLILFGVAVSLPNKDEMTSEMITECNRWYDKENTRSNTHFKRGWKLCYRWLKNELK